MAGNGNPGYSGDGGPATAAMLYPFGGIATDTAGNLYISDVVNMQVRKVTPAGIISTVAGSGKSGYSGDGGPATAAQMYNPYGIAVDAAGNIYIADADNHRIRLVARAAPAVTTTVITSIAQTTASGGGTITFDGGASVTARGVCWSTSANPTILDMCTNNGTGTGAFTSSITGLSANTNYHVRAYATNSMGTSYGSDVNFTTLAPMPDFQIGTSSGGSYSATVAAGARAVYNLTTTGMNSFSGSVSFACSGLPSAATCSISPSALSVSGSAAVPFTATVTTTTRTSAVRTSAARRRVAGIIDFGRFPGGGSGAAIILCLGSLTMVLCMSRQRRISMAFLMLCSVGLAGCGGGSKSTSTQGTPAGTYSIILTATSGSLSHATNLTLIVQ
jgi:hypothetical protein